MTMQISHATMLLVLAAATLVFALSLAGYAAMGARRRMAERIGRVCGRSSGPDHSAVRDKGELSGLLTRIGERVAASSLVGRAEVERTGLTLMAAGIEHPKAVQYFFGVKAALALLAIGLVHLWLPNQTFLTGAGGAFAGYLGAALVGWRVPDLVVSRRRKARMEAVERGLPDALDLLVICSEAGLGFDHAVGRVAREVAQAHPDLGREFAKLAAEMRVLPDRSQALSNMAERLQLDSVRSFTGMLAQAMRYGTPLAQALRVISSELRTERMVRFEARAAKLPVMITLPMILFILPCVFIVVGGPALIDALKMMSNMPR